MRQVTSDILVYMVWRDKAKILEANTINRILLMVQVGGSYLQNSVQTYSSRHEDGLPTHYLNAIKGTLT
jgi:hypothetical protein